MTESLFPFGFPAATASYLTLYVITLCIHIVFMSYVLAGSVFVAAEALRRCAVRSRAASVLIDWLPFSIGVAITAGVAPLLFVQILYPSAFYSANLLLFHRWLAIIPVLIVGFYLAYAMKSAWIARRSAGLRIAAAVAALACFAFTGYSWTENHVLSTRESAWPSFYASGAHFFGDAAIPLRFLTWLAGAFAVLAPVLGWQLYGGAIATARSAVPGVAADRQSARTVAGLGLGGLLFAAAAAAVYGATLPASARAVCVGPMAGPYAALALVGGALAAIAWLATWRLGALRSRWLVLASVGLGAVLVGVAVIRESLRLSSVDLAKLVRAHESAAEVGGVTAFGVSFVAVAALIAWCVRAARRAAQT